MACGCVNELLATFRVAAYIAEHVLTAAVRPLARRGVKVHAALVLTVRLPKRPVLVAVGGAVMPVVLVLLCKG